VEEIELNHREIWGLWVIQSLPKSVGAFLYASQLWTGAVATGKPDKTEKESLWYCFQFSYMVFTNASDLFKAPCYFLCLTISVDRRKDYGNFHKITDAVLWAGHQISGLSQLKFHLSLVAQTHPQALELCLGSFRFGSSPALLFFQTCLPETSQTCLCSMRSGAIGDGLVGKARVFRMDDRWTPLQSYYRHIMCSLNPWRICMVLLVKKWLCEQKTLAQEWLC